MSKPITDRPIYVAMRYMYVFLLINIYFLLCNITFIVVYFLADFTFENILLFYLTLIPAGPAIAAVLSSMGRFIREREISPTLDYWKAYKRNFGISMRYWFIQLTVMFILVVDFYYATRNINAASPLFLILLFICGMIMMYAFPILTRFEVKMKNLFLISIYSNFKYFKTTLLNATSIISFGFIFYYIPSISSLFAVSLICFFIMFNLQSPFIQMEREMTEQH
ncbi:YesL family protein [Aquibacillus kalidii]|uniref:YesL family protein n=1 Tax=Aquibacillus kalidii TaxID=2762597 RepID=UPI0016443139|nr:DUF624 domain-containing protein [Aquibacillus kalidii]